MVGSSCTGQNALLALPSKSWTDKRSADNYSLPKKLVYDKEGLLKKSGGARGLFVWKVTKTGKLQARRLSVTLDRRHLVVTSHRIRSVRGLVQAATGRDASIKQIPFAVVDRIQRGPHTTRFRTAERNNGATLVRRAYAHTVDSLSIVYYSFDTNALETLDVIVPNDVTFVLILTALEDLLALARTERVRYVHSIDYLHYQWARLGKPVRDALALNEWNGWAESVGATLPKAELATMFREDCDMLGHADERLPLPAVVLLLEDVREAQAGGSMEHHPLEALWTVLVRTDPVPFAGGNNQAGDVSRNADLRDSEESISTVAFLSFLRSQQKEYQSSLEQVADLVRSLNVQQTPDELLNKKARQKTMQSNGDRLARTRFFSFLMSDANDLLDPLDGQLGVQDMTRPLSHYWINTSHDTFLATTAHSLAGKSRYAKTEAGPEKVDGQMYLTALFRGVRCLELDVWENELLEPVLARYQPIGLNYEFAVPLDDVLRDIRFFLREHPYSFPIILNIENHCSTEGQLNVAKLLYNTLGAAQLILEPEGELHDFATLPSPEAARGKVIVLAKRPKALVTGCKVRNDDFDDENHTYQPSSHTNDTSVVSLEDDDDATVGTTIVGFNSQGPIKAKDPHAPVPSAAEIVATAQLEAAQARSDAQYAQEKAEALDKLADQKETETSILTAKAGMTATEVKRRAAAAAGRSFDKGADDRPEGKFLKEEGIEMHEILPGVVQGGRDQYARTAQEAMEAGNRVAICFTRYNQAEAALFEASQNFERARGREQALAQEAQKAAAEARSHREYADSARVRVEQVRELQRNALENTSSAGNVVVTAMTEAKISEKRAADAEARAERAKEAAARDQQRADEETRKEESLENEVTELHAQCSEASEAAKAVRERVEKAATMLDRVNEQIHLIENSSQYRKEVAEGVKGGASVRHGGSFVAKHSSKLEEREICRDLIREASEENATAEARRNRIYAALEDKNHLWNEQREVVAQARRVADRSTHAAEELAEHAEEEREAAMLRYTARQRAEATAENRDSHTQSLQTQLEEAERASTEAANIAVQSRKLATRLLADGEKAKDLDHFVRTMKEAEGARNKAKIEYDAAKLEKDRCNDRMMEEKRRLDTNAEVFTRAQRAAADAVDRIQYEHLYQQEAIVAYNEALMLRSQAEDAARRSKANMAKADEKARAAQSASEYKRLTDRVVELPTNLARLSMLHRLKFQNWEKSLSLSAAHVHSFAQHVLFKMLNDDSLEQCKNIKAFTQNHLCRVFPSWNVLPSKMFTNYDPIFAWSMGCQLVPMNFHSADERLFVADGRFRTNGSCGYVLKPSSLAENDTNSVESEEWTLEVLCGSNIPIKKPKGTPNLFVKVSLFAGSTMKDKSAFYKTSIQHNYANPVWEGNNFVFAVDNPSLAIIVFSVWDQNPNGLEDFIAAAAFPASSLREGYRSVSLFDVHHSRSGPFAFASLLVKALKS